jgi:hypothetical protein
MLMDSHGDFWMCRFMPQSMPNAGTPMRQNAAQRPAEPQHISMTCGANATSATEFAASEALASACGTGGAFASAGVGNTSNFFAGDVLTSAREGMHAVPTFAFCHRCSAT